MTTTRQFRGAIFDVDGVLVDSPPSPSSPDARRPTAEHVGVAGVRYLSLYGLQET